MTTQRQQLTRQQQAIVNVQDAAERALRKEAQRVNFWWHRLPSALQRQVLDAIAELEKAGAERSRS